MSETRRLAALDALGLLDTPPEERFDRIARIARRLLGTPIALVSLVAADQQFFKACLGLAERQTPRAVSFCAHALGRDEALVIPDATLDLRFAGNPLVTGPPGIRFYAGYPVHAAGGEPVGTLCVIDTRPREITPQELDDLRDLAALVEAELNLHDMSTAEAERARLGCAQDRFLRVAAHELRTPLTSIRGYAEELLEDAEPPLAAGEQKMVGAILRNSERLEGLLEDMLLVLRLESHHVELERVELDLYAVAAHAVTEMRDMTNKADVKMELEGAPTLAAGDERLLRRAVRGLLRNGLGDSPGGTALRVHVHGGPAGVGVSVTDSGGGLTDEDRRRASERFYRATTTGGRAGTGLELAIARGVADAHGGTLELAANGDVGTTVTLLLPAA